VRVKLPGAGPAAHRRWPLESESLVMSRAISVPWATPELTCRRVSHSATREDDGG
jgi:hypothetical protein